MRGEAGPDDFNGTIIETGTDSYRLVSTRARSETPAKAS
ncbi:ATPase [Streptomyces griseoviridis]|uniref:ATPase n=1 Tax=Streptomyces griseoviridis TaxID=45398 RepID=A0A3Q9KY27_STRGD|nr:ATPase [Streptomyces griseoviridis]AZS87222.1 ATPase [Streptomyces griseoviridis]QCN85926.1 ATPase [Streptomyces griseoviridis]